MRGGLGHVLAREPSPEPRAGPLFRVCGGLPGGFRIGDALGLQPREGIAEDAAGRQSIPKVLAVEQIGYPAGAELMPAVPHRPRVGFLQPLPERHGPGVRPAPRVHHLPGLALGQVDAVDPAHGREGTDASGEAAGQLLHLADLTLVLRHILDGDAESRGGVDLVDVLAALKDPQLLGAAVRLRQPGVHPRLDG